MKWNKISESKTNLHFCKDQKFFENIVTNNLRKPSWWWFQSELVCKQKLNSYIYARMSGARRNNTATQPICLPALVNSVNVDAHKYVAPLYFLSQIWSAII